MDCSRRVLGARRDAHASDAVNHELQQILHTYRETQEPPEYLKTLDGQRIKTRVTQCKVRCACGAVYLSWLPIVAEPK